MNCSCYQQRDITNIKSETTMSHPKNIYAEVDFFVSVNAQLQMKGRKRARVWRNMNERIHEESEVAASVLSSGDSSNSFSEP